ncbi:MULTISPECIES: hypothetical protein [Gammaproteobacteria]|jgi:hypothetical protein|uniref:Uncharacterized protein n=1 Tax=Vreelandella halophila TaxID=86177 RepID=A0A9X4Y7J2_9GAMM|nr:MULTISPECIES: hypothetical protein [Gammaproteobacteria]KAA8979265.1 hypothetical protein F3089_12810 [Halospina sp. K52047b]MYL25207.1 hypothetical protein [Halomonas utahensis]MYL75269.1 hypothetical protein [Halomonas sp. 22501_18_FS]
MSKIRDYQQQVQDVIEKGINTVEKQHKTLAERPFELAEKVEQQAKSYSVKSVRAKHDDYANTAYETLRVWNQRLGDYANSLIGRFDKEAAPAEKQAEQKSASSAQSGAQKKSASSASKQSSGAKKSTGGAKKQTESQASA